MLDCRAIASPSLTQTLGSGLGDLNQMTRVLIVDDQKVIRQGLKALLEPEPSIEVVGMAADGRVALEQIKTLCPDVVLMDMNMPGMDGVTATRAVSQQFKATKVVILTGFEDVQHLTEAMRAGAKGFLTKDTSSKTLITAVQTVCAGGIHLGPGQLDKIVAEAPDVLKQRADLAMLGKATLLSQYAYRAIRKSFKKMSQTETEVLKDLDPEPLHQMRVGMRRLRTTVQSLDSILKWPKNANDKSVRAIARTLGDVRDLDVLKITLENLCSSQLPSLEQTQLTTIVSNLQQKRQHDFGQLQKTLNSSRWRKLRIAVQDWLEHPHFQAIATQPVPDILPELLLPLLSQLFLHPGWLVSPSIRLTRQHLPRKVGSQQEMAELSSFLQQHGEVLHSLRKQVKQVRYQAELFMKFYGADFTAQVAELRNIQEILGQLQDRCVLQSVLAEHLDTNLAVAMPVLARQLQHEQWNIWRDFHLIRQRYLDRAFRRSLYQQVITPWNPERETELKALCPSVS
jgi:CHAD domain-containing protein/ActR/RegA family two-component response regulator